MKLAWQDLRVEVTTVGTHRTIRVTHLPTGVAVEAEGECVSDRELRRRLMPELEQNVAARLEDLRAR
jgi:predicted membrane GTPase involved in stress response